MVDEWSNPISIAKAGVFVEPLIHVNQAGKVIGVTSKGIFLLFDHRVLFLTSEDYNNPFVLHVPDRANFPQKVNLNQEASFRDAVLGVGEKNYSLNAISKFVPAPLPFVHHPDSLHKNAAQIVALFQSLNMHGHQDSMLYIVDALLNGREPSDNEQIGIWRAVRKLRIGIRSSDIEESKTALQHLVGSGKGLTPSGDDFICGFLLIQNATHQPDAAGDGFLDRLNAVAVDLAMQKSTWISANLIEASTLRLADERIGRAAQLLLGMCRMDSVTIANSLESFGSSSGVDAFSGMAAALLP